VKYLSSTLNVACAVAGFVTVASCGSKKPQVVPPENVAVTSPSTEQDSQMESADALESIDASLDRKRTSAARCLSEAVDAKELPRNARGKVTLGFTISTAGKASDIKIVKSSLESASLTACIADIVGKIQFANLKEAREWSYTYAFEAM
jgi:predicted small lipoprotein YifL